MPNHEKSHQKKQINIAILTMIGGVIAFCVTQWLMVRNENLQHTSAQRNVRMEAMLNDRLIIYKDACKAVGEIMGNALISSPELNKSINDFDKIYFGEMALIEDPNSVIITSAKDFRLDCARFIASEKQMTDLEKLRSSAVAFTSVCKKRSEELWEDLNNDKDQDNVKQ